MSREERRVAAIITKEVKARTSEDACPACVERLMTYPFGKVYTHQEMEDVLRLPLALPERGNCREHG